MIAPFTALFLKIRESPIANTSSHLHSPRTRTLSLFSFQFPIVLGCLNPASLCCPLAPLILSKVFFFFHHYVIFLLFFPLTWLFFLCAGFRQKVFLRSIICLFSLEYIPIFELILFFFFLSIEIDLVDSTPEMKYHFYMIQLFVSYWNSTDLSILRSNNAKSYGFTIKNYLLKPAFVGTKNNYFILSLDFKRFCKRDFLITLHITSVGFYFMKLMIKHTSSR